MEKLENRFEQGLSATQEGAVASIAISIKRIADKLEALGGGIDPVSLAYQCGQAFEHGRRG